MNEESSIHGIYCIYISATFMPHRVWLYCLRPNQCPRIILNLIIT